MATPEPRRKLAAILVADVVGYSRLVGSDEDGTIARLKALRQDVIEPSVVRHHGHTIKWIGDGVLVEFPSVVDALRNAVEVQRTLAERNAGVPEDRQMRFRVGINLGDIIFEDDDIFGDGVNVAARLETLAESGGICVSRAVRDQVGDRVDVAFEDLGEQTVKNISRPIHVFRVVLDAGKPDAAAKPAAAAVSADKPSIAVLPFANMSGDPEQEFFADGITEDIITELSRFRDLFVISRTSSFALKGKAANVQDVAKQLGVQFVVEGSVRKAGNRVRVTVQLIDAATDHHLWAERYDRDLEDIFAIQDEVTQAIVAILPGRIEAATRERAEQKPTDNMAAYECVLAGKVAHHRNTKEDNAEALRLLDRAIELDPKFAHAHAWKACTLGQAWARNYCDDRDAVVLQVTEELQTALALDENDSDVHRILAALNLNFRDYDKAVYHEERALSLNPNDDLIVVQQGEILTWLGQPEEGIEWIKKAMRLNPFHPERFWSHLGRAYYSARCYGEAVEAFNRISAADHTTHAYLAGAHAQMENQSASSSHAEEVRKREPDFSVDGYLATLQYKLDADIAHLRDGLLKAGLPA